MARLRRRGRRRPGPASKALTLSATDAEWAMVREKAARRRLSVSRYAVALVLGGDEDAADEPALVLDAHAQREMFETVRAFRTLMGEGDEAPALIEDLRTRVALLFDAWALAMVRDGRGEALGALLAARVGAANAARVLERIEALAAAGPAPPSRKAPEDASGASGQASLFC